MIQNVQDKLESLESSLYNDSVSVGREITKDMEMILTGINSTNHYLKYHFTSKRAFYFQLGIRVDDDVSFNKSFANLFNLFNLFKHK